MTRLEADHWLQPPTYGYTVYANTFKRSVPGRVPTRFRLKLTRSSREVLCFQCRSRPGNALICLPTANSGLPTHSDRLHELSRRIERLSVAGRTDPEAIVLGKLTIAGEMRRIARELSR